MTSWKDRLNRFGFASMPRLDDKAADAQRQAEMEAHAKSLKMAYTRGMMCHSIHSPNAACEWSDEKLTQKKKRR